jgi:hypothetical protein
MFGITEGGEAWLVENQAELDVRVRSKQLNNEITDDDISF